MADGVDYTIASKIAPTPIDPLGSTGKLMSILQSQQGVQHGQLENQMLGQQIQSHQAVARAISAATDPGTGQVDYGKALNLAKDDPAAAWAVPELAGQVVDQQTKQQQLKGVSLDVQMKRLGIMSNKAQSLLQDTSLTKDKVVKSLGELTDSGLFDDPDAVHQLAAFEAQLPDDPDKLRQNIQQHGQAADFSLARLQAQYAQTNGGLTPGEGASPTSVMAQGPNDTLVPSTVPLAKYAEMAKGGPVATGAPMTAQGVPLATAGNPVQVGSDPLTNAPKLATQGQLAASAAGAPVAGTGPLATGQVAGPSAGVVQAKTANMEANVAQEQALQARAAIVPARRAALNNLSATLQDFTPGPNNTLTYKANAQLVQALDTFHIPVPANIRQGVASVDEANKLLAQIALDQWGSLGGTGSNEQLGVTMKANPTLAASKLGLKNLIPMLQGNEDGIEHQFEANQKFQGTVNSKTGQPYGPGSYSSFLPSWNKIYDPRVFQAAHMDPAQAKIMRDRMTPEDRKAFDRAQAMAKQAGWIGGE